MPLCMAGSVQQRHAARWRGEAAACRPAALQPGPPCMLLCYCAALRDPGGVRCRGRHTLRACCHGWALSHLRPPHCRPGLRAWPNSVGQRRAMLLQCCHANLLCCTAANRAAPASTTDSRQPQKCNLGKEIDLQPPPRRNRDGAPRLRRNPGETEVNSQTACAVPTHSCTPPVQGLVPASSPSPPTRPLHTAALHARKAQTYVTRERHDEHRDPPVPRGGTRRLCGPAALATSPASLRSGARQPQGRLEQPCRTGRSAGAWRAGAAVGRARDGRRCA